MKRVRADRLTTKSQLTTFLPLSTVKKMQKQSQPEAMISMKSVYMNPMNPARLSPSGTPSHDSIPSAQANKRGSVTISLDNLSPDVAKKLKTLDSEGHGTIHMHDLTSLVEREAIEKRALFNYRNIGIA